MRVFIPGSNRLLISKKNDRSHIKASYSHRLYTTQRQAALSTVMTLRSDYINNAESATQISKENDDVVFSFFIDIDACKYISGTFSGITSLFPISQLTMPLTGIYIPAVKKIFTRYH